MLQWAAAGALLAFLALAAGARAAEDTGPARVPVEIGWEVFELEVAADPLTRARGLMGRRSIPEAGGMLFHFPESRPRSFWMKNCLVDMDLLYLDEAGRVVSSHHMVVEPPRRAEESERAYGARLERYRSGAPARYAIELKAGTAARLGVGPGTRIALPPLPAPH